MRSHPQEWELKRCARSIFSTNTTSSRWPKTLKILFRYMKHNIIYYSIVRSRHDPTVFPESDNDLVDVCSRAIFQIFRKVKICFFLSCEYIWRVDVFNGVLIYIESCLSHIFFRLPIISGFSLYRPNPIFFYSDCQ